MNQSSDDQAECPLCMEPFEVDDLNFFPCTCGYQICRFCWHRIRTDENGLCPACRKAYPENPADFKPLSQEQVAKLKAEKRQKEQQKKQKATESRKHLANVRVVQKNLVFVVGLPIRLADPNVLKKHEYFGKFGKIQKVVINQSTSYAGAMGPSASAYVTYNRYEDALRAIQAINNIWVDNRQIKTSLGTTKYCSHFIKAQTCPKPDCMYLHDLGDPEASFTKEEMQRGKHQEYEKNLFEQFNNSMSQERKTTPSPPALGNSLPNSDCSSNFPSVNKEAWPSLQNGTTQPNTGGGTGSTLINAASEIVSSASTTTTTTTTTNASASMAQVSVLSAKPQQTQLQPSKAKQKDKNNSNEKTSNNKRKGKEKQMNAINNNHVSSNNNTSSNNNSNNSSSTSINNNNNYNNNSNNNANNNNNNNNINNNNNNNNNSNITVADKHDSLAKNNKEKEKRVSGDTIQIENDVNARVQSSNNRSSLYSSENTIFSNNSFSKMSPTGSKDSVPLPNGFIKVPDNVTVNYETNSGDGSGHNCKETQNIETRLLSNADNERVPAIENDSKKPLVNGFLGESMNGSFDKISCNQKSNYSYQNGNLNSSSNTNCQQNIFNNYISLNKFGSHLKSDSVLGENESFMNQNSHILGQQNFLLKQQIAQQQRNQPSLQQMLIQQQQNVYQQPQNQYSQDFRLVQQQGQQPMNGFHSQSQQHFSYMQQSNLRDQFLLQQKQNHLVLNNYSPSGNNFIHLPKSDDLVVVDNLIPQHKFIENGLNHTNLFASDYKLKDNRKADESVSEKGNRELHNRIGDDELGFDPFHETQKALADLMEKELLIQQNKQALQHKNDQYYHQSPQNYQTPHSFDNCGRGLNHFQVNMLNQQNHLMGGKLLAQIHSQQILNSSNQKSTGSNRLDGIRCTLPPPGFGPPAQNGLPGHLNNFAQGIPRNSNSRKILPFMSLSNGENSFQPHYVPNGVIKSDDWPESLRSHVQEGNTSSPSSGSPSFSSGPKVWSNIGNCSDWTALDPAIVSSSRPQHLSLHTQSLLNNQGLSQLHQNHLQNQMCQLNIGNVLSHNNWSTPRQNEDNWSTHIQTTVPPPGFTFRHTGAEMKKPVLSGIEGLE